MAYRVIQGCFGDTTTSSSRSALDYFCPGLDRARIDRDQKVAQFTAQGPAAIQANEVYNETKACAMRNIGLAATGAAILGYFMFKRR